MKPLKATKEDEKDFERIFGTPLRPFMHPIVGFLIVEFDEFLKVPDWVSMRDYIEQNHGTQAVELVLRLIRLPEEE